MGVLQPDDITAIRAQADAAIAAAALASQASVNNISRALLPDIGLSMPGDGAASNYRGMGWTESGLIVLYDFGLYHYVLNADNNTISNDISVDLNTVIAPATGAAGSIWEKSFYRTATETMASLFFGTCSAGALHMIIGSNLAIVSFAINAAASGGVYLAGIYSQGFVYLTDGVSIYKYNEAGALISTTLITGIAGETMRWSSVNDTDGTYWYVGVDAFVNSNKLCRINLTTGVASFLSLPLKGGPTGVNGKYVQCFGTKVFITSVERRYSHTVYIVDTATFAVEKIIEPVGSSGLHVGFCSDDYRVYGALWGSTMVDNHQRDLYLFGADLDGNMSSALRVPLPTGYDLCGMNYGGTAETRIRCLPSTWDPKHSTRILIVAQTPSFTDLLFLVITPVDWLPMQEAAIEIISANISNIQSAVATVDGRLDTEIPDIIQHLIEIKGVGFTVESLRAIYSAVLGISSATPGQIADAVCDELLAGHTTAGSLAKRLSDLATQSSIDAINTLLSGQVQAGSIVIPGGTVKGDTLTLYYANSYTGMSFNLGSAFAPFVDGVNEVYLMAKTRYGDVDASAFFDIKGTLAVNGSGAAVATFSISSTQMRITPNPSGQKYSLEVQIKSPNGTVLKSAEILKLIVEDIVRKGA